MSEQSQEFSAKSVDAAIEEGLRRMGVGRDQVDIEILHEGSRGLLGIGSTNARVRLSKRAPARPEPQAAPAATPVAETPAKATGDASASAASVSAAPASAAPAISGAASEETAARRETASAGALDDSTLDDSDDDFDDDADFEEGDEEGDDFEDDDDSVADDLDGSDEGEVMALASELLEEMVSLMGLDATVEGSRRQDEDDDRPAIYLNLRGDDLGALIGRQGETLASIQYLLRLMVNQRLHRWPNLVVDVDGYKEQRGERLAAMALRMADQVVETGRSVALEPMPANERRLIHIALRNHPSVYTESIGDDTRRKVQILLK